MKTEDWKMYNSCAFSNSFSVYGNGAVRNVNLSHVGFYKMFVETFSGAEGAEGAACFCWCSNVVIEGDSSPKSGNVWQGNSARMCAHFSLECAQ